MLRGRIFSISGIDGCGKTTIIEALMDSLQKDGCKARYVWLRYNHYLTKILLGFCRLIGLTVYEYYEGYRIGYHNFYLSKLVSHAFIITTYIDTFFASTFRLYLPLLFNKTIICDRWIPDILVDLEIDTKLPISHKGFYNKAFWCMVPKSAKIILVKRGFEEVLSAREEHKHDKNFKHRFEIYRSLEMRSEYRVLDNTGSIDNTVAQLKKALR